MSNILCKASDYVEIYVSAQMVNVKTFFSPQMSKLCIRPMSNT